jgi:hypothetical protein
MKALGLIFVFLLFPYFIFTQPVINQNDMPSAGDTIRTSLSIDVGTINYEATGNSFTWDFSSLLPFSQTVDTFVSVQQTPWLYQLIFFTSSNLARKLTEFDQFPGFQMTDTYEYYKNSSSDFRMTGNAVTLNGIPIPNKFQSADIIYKFPLNNGNVDSSLSTYEINIPSIGYAGGSKKRVNHVDGWGTLITPYGSFQTIRVKSDIIQIDSLYLDTLGIGFPIYREYTEYKWLGDGFGIPLCTITNEAMVSTVQYIDSVRNIIVGVPEVSNSDESFQVFPNPSKGDFTLRFSEAGAATVEVNVFDLTGNNIYRQEFPAAREIPIQLNDLTRGVYVMVIRKENNLFYRKINIE